MAATEKSHERGQLDDCIDRLGSEGSSITGLYWWDCQLVLDEKPPNSLVG